MNFLRPTAWAGLFCLLALVTSTLGESLSGRQFEALSLQLSEPSQYFDTDNLISNETSYQQLLPLLREVSPSGRVYLGVGPDQNFTYIAQFRPEIAFILDVRRDNLLELLYFKVLFEQSANRWEYLSRLLAKPLPAGFSPPQGADAGVLVAFFDPLPSRRSWFEQVFEASWNRLRKQYPRLVTEEDRATLHRIAFAFYNENLDLRFRSHGRPPRPYYPTFRDLLLERDSTGQMCNYLNDEEDYQFLRRMQRQHRIIPVVGDFAGKTALQGIGRYLRRRGHQVGLFYLSNVEFYLFQAGTFPRFVENVRSLPVNEDSLFIRSYFGQWRPHPAAQPGHRVTMLAQYICTFLEQHEGRPYAHYGDLVTRDYLQEAKKGGSTFQRISPSRALRPKH